MKRSIKTIGALAVSLALALATTACAPGGSTTDDELIDFVKEHQPEVVIYDVALPYEENWRFLRLLQSSEALKKLKWVITTTHKRRLEELVGECGEVFEIVGKPYDMDQIVNAVRVALESR